MNKNWWLDYETIYYSGAFLLGLFVRFYNLGQAPLSDFEASWALQALQISQPANFPEPAAIGPNPGYVLLTAALFSIFGSSDFVARFWPAIAGSLIVFLPMIILKYSGDLFRSQTNNTRWIGILLAYGLAIAPGLVTISRLAGGPMLGLGFCLLAAAFWLIRQPVLAGISAGIAIISGPDIWLGLLVLGVAFLIISLLTRAQNRDSSPEEATEEIKPGLENTDQILPHSGQNTWRDFLIAFVTTILLVVTLFLRYPRGLGAWFNSLITFVNGWFTPSGIPISRMLSALFFYELLAVMFGTIMIFWAIAQVIRGQPTKKPLLFLIAWVLIGSILILLYPGRQVYHQIWILVPLWALAILSIGRLVIGEKINPVSILMALIILVLAGLFWYTIASTTRIPGDYTNIGVQLAVLVGILSMGAMIVGLISIGWSWKTSQTGLILGLCMALFFYLSSVLWSSSQTRHNKPQELWVTNPSPGQERLLTKVIGELSSWNTGFEQSIDITSIVDTPSLRWALRHFPNTRFLTHLGREELPSIVITHIDDEVPAIAASYRGEDFQWWAIPGWTGALPPDVPRWFAYREAPLIYDKIILWSRADLFPSQSLSPESVTENQEPVILEDPLQEINPQVEEDQ